MIKLNKGPVPLSLAANSATWTTELMDYISRGIAIPDSLKDSYNQHDVKEALKIETSGHCMYCQSPIGHVAHGHIEHIKPKAQGKFPELTFEWTNLGLACPVCNINKSDNYDPSLEFLNPYQENPSDFIMMFGFVLYQKPANIRGEYTINKLDLNRPSLIERRKERIDLICGLVDKCVNASNVNYKKMILSQIRIETEQDKPFSLITRAFAKAQLKVAGISL